MPDATATAEAPRGEVVGRFSMSVVSGERTSESEEKWNGRADALARWLVAEWQRRGCEQHAEGGDQHAF